MSNPQRDLELLHPNLRESVHIIQEEIIGRHRAPFKVFETGRLMERQKFLLGKRKARSAFSRHFYSFETDVKCYSTAVDFVYYDTRWSWDIRSTLVRRWYQLFGELVLTRCSNLEWGGYWRQGVNYTHFQLNQKELLKLGIDYGDL